MAIKKRNGIRFAIDSAVKLCYAYIVPVLSTCTAMPRRGGYEPKSEKEKPKTEKDTTIIHEGDIPFLR